MKFFCADRRGYCGSTNSLELHKTDPFNRPVYSLPGFHSQQDSIEFIGRLYPDGLSIHGWQYLIDRHDFVRTSSGEILWDHHTSVELLFEAIRQRQFPSLPSRFQSYFAWTNLDAAIAFCPPKSLIYEVEADNYHTADMRLLTLGVQGIMAMLYAEKYWKGEFTDNPQQEVLLKPPVAIIKAVCCKV